MPRNFLPLSHFPIPKRTSKFIQISSPDRSLGRRLALKIGKQGNAAVVEGMMLNLEKTFFRCKHSWARLLGLFLPPSLSNSTTWLDLINILRENRNEAEKRKPKRCEMTVFSTFLQWRTLINVFTVRIL